MSGALVGIALGVAATGSRRRPVARAVHSAPESPASGPHEPIAPQNTDQPLEEILDKILPRSRSVIRSVGGVPALVAVAPVLVALSHLIVESRLDTQYLAAWLAAVNLVNLWLLGVIAIFQAVLNLLWQYLLLVTLLGPPGQSLPSSRQYWTVRRVVRILLIAAFGSFVTLLVVSPAGTGQVAFCLLFGVFLVGTVLGSSILSRRGDDIFIDFIRRNRRRVAGYALGATALVIFLTLFNLTLPPGVPRERVSVGTDIEQSDGYVLSVDDTSLTIAYVGGGIRRVPVDEVVSRTICPDDRYRILPGLAIFFGRALVDWPAACVADGPVRTRYP